MSATIAPYSPNLPTLKYLLGGIDCVEHDNRVISSDTTGVLYQCKRCKRNSYYSSHYYKQKRFEADTERYNNLPWYKRLFEDKPSMYDWYSFGHWESCIGSEG